MDEKKILTLSPEDIAKILEPYKNEETDPLIEECQRKSTFFQKAYCPTCGGPLDKSINPERPFVRGHLTEAAIGVCRSCGYKVQP